MDVNKSINEMEMDAEEQQSFVISLLYFILLLFHQSVGIRPIFKGWALSSLINLKLANRSYHWKNWAILIDFFSIYNTSIYFPILLNNKFHVQSRSHNFMGHMRNRS